MDTYDFSYLMRRDAKVKSIKEVMDVIQDIKTIIVQYNKWALEKLFPEITLECFINTDGKLITRLDVKANEKALKFEQSLKKQCKDNFDMYKDIEGKYNDLMTSYQKDKNEWLADTAKRMQEWDMIKSLTKTPDYNKSLDTKALEEQIYKDLRKEYGLDN